MNYSIIALFLVVALGILIYWLMSSSGSGNPGDWSADQKIDVRNYIINNKFISIQPCANSTEANSYVDCLVDILSQTYSVSDVKKEGFALSADDTSKMASCTGICFGTKGNWSAGLKSMLTDQLKSSGLTDDCVNCIISGLESGYDPSIIIMPSFTSIANQVATSCASSGKCSTV